MAIVLGRKGGGGGGGSQPGTVWPVADPTDVTVDDTTYDNEITGSGKMTVLVFPAGDTAAFALAQQGAAFPFFVIPTDTSDELIYFGENDKGIFDGNSIGFMLTNSGFVGMKLHAGVGVDFRLGEDDPNVGTRSRVTSPLTVQSVTFSSGNGAPDAQGGNEGDIYVRIDPGGANQTLYRCTVPGSAGNATWVGIL